MAYKKNNICYVHKLMVENGKKETHCVPTWNTEDEVYSIWKTFIKILIQLVWTCWFSGQNL